MEVPAAEKLELGELTVHDEQKIIVWNACWKKMLLRQEWRIARESQRVDQDWRILMVTITFVSQIRRLEADHTSGYSWFRVSLRCNWPLDGTDSFEVEATQLTTSSPEKKEATFDHNTNRVSFSPVIRESDQIRVIVQVKKKEIKVVQEAIADVTFVIENQELKSSSKRLIKASPVFASMLEGGFAEAESKRVKIEDATFEEFSAFIGALLESGPIAPNNVEALHRLSDKYDTADLLRRCCEFVWKSGMDVLQKFIVAEKWDDGPLLQRLTGEICDANTLKKLEAGGMTAKLKPDTVSLILKKGFSFI